MKYTLYVQCNDYSSKTELHTHFHNIEDSEEKAIEQARQLTEDYIKNKEHEVEYAELSEGSGELNDKRVWHYPERST